MSTTVRLPRLAGRRKADDGKKAMSMEASRGSEEKENHVLDDFRQGDLLLARVKPFPYWPAVVSSDSSSTLTRTRTVRNQTMREVHVLFLNDDKEQLWVKMTDKNVIPLCSVEEFAQLRVIALTSRERDAHLAFKVKANCVDAWNRGMAIAQRLLSLDRASRVEQLQWRESRLRKTPILCLACDPPIAEASMQMSSDLIRPEGGENKRSASPSSSNEEKRRRTSERVLILASQSETERLREAVEKEARKTTRDSHLSATTTTKGVSRNATRSAVDMLKEQCFSYVACMNDGPVCMRCCSPFDETEDGYKCSQCATLTHLSCTDEMPDEAGQFKCHRCRLAWPPCAICGESGDARTARCSMKRCPAYYHIACIAGYKLAGYAFDPKPNGSFVCPAHRCCTCFSYGRDQAATYGTLMSCMRCPVAFHKRDSCVPAGAHLITSSLLLCPLHFERELASVKKDPHINIDYCFDCQKCACAIIVIPNLPIAAGTLVCCERCPAAFHKTCLDASMQETVEDCDFLCTECQLGRFPLFNDIVWVKYANFRWWPSLIVYPLQIPDSIEKKPHSVGEFVVRFLGTGQYAWIPHGRCFRYVDGDQAERGGGDRQYQKALVEAGQLLAIKKEMKEKEDECVILPPRNLKDYRHIKAWFKEEGNENHQRVYGMCGMLQQNVAGTGARLNVHKVQSEYPICNCDWTKDKPCSSDSECSNRATQIECNQDCPAGEKCCNKRFQKCEYIPAQPFDAGKKLGYGLRALVDVAQGAFVYEYCGEVIGKMEFKKRWQKKMESNDTGFYFLTLDRERTIDAEPAGNLARFMNHSCRANCSTFVWQVGDDIRVGLFACRPIKAGEELTFHYNMDSLDAEGQIPCRCGEATCMGVIGKRLPRVPAGVAAIANRATERDKRRKKKKKRQQLDKRCFQCRQEVWGMVDGTRPVICSRRACPRVFHPGCLENAPTEKLDSWICESHRCRECRKPATRPCSKCPQAWCEKHYGKNMSGNRETTICNHCANPSPPTLEAVPIPDC